MSTVGCTEYVTRIYTPIYADKWFRTGGVTILNRGVGLWQRAVTYRVTVYRMKVCVTYPNLWDRFWASDGSGKTVTRSTSTEPATNFTETVVGFSVDPPSDALPSPFQREGLE